MRAAALRATTALLRCTHTVPASDSHIFGEFVLPVVHRMASDRSPLVRLCVAECVPVLAETARRFVDVVHAMKQRQQRGARSGGGGGGGTGSGGGGGGDEVDVVKGSFDAELGGVQDAVQGVLTRLLTADASPQARWARARVFCLPAHAPTHPPPPTQSNQAHAAAWRHPPVRVPRAGADQ